MKIADNWIDYQLLDTSSGEKLEKWGNYILTRPDPQIIWNTPKNPKLWNSSHAHYHRSSKGGGSWDIIKKIPDKWQISYDSLVFNIKPTGFKHTGLFPEQAVNWDFFKQKISQQNKEVRVLNLFAYTGGATLACASAGACVVHVDASKGAVAWAKENAASSNLASKPIRYIVDDCMKFIEREKRRGNKYHGIIMDPPSYGRGSNGEVWNLEDCIFDLLNSVKDLIADDFLFFALNSYSTGLSPCVMSYLLHTTIAKDTRYDVNSFEIGLPVKNTNQVLPCGNTAMMIGG